MVGATAPTELATIRDVAPGLPFLVPGVGAQGGAIDAVLEQGPATAEPGAGRPGGGLLVNVSRGIAGAASSPSDGAARATSWNSSRRPPPTGLTTSCATLADREHPD